MYIENACLERVFSERVEARTNELSKRRRVALTQAGTLRLEVSRSWPWSPLSDATGFFVEEHLTAAKAFTTFTLFSLLKTPLTILSFLIGHRVGSVAAKC